jgi:hypothetical protein
MPKSWGAGLWVVRCSLLAAPLGGLINAKKLVFVPSVPCSDPTGTVRGWNRHGHNPGRARDPPSPSLKDSDSVGLFYYSTSESFAMTLTCHLMVTMPSHSSKLSCKSRRPYQLMLECGLLDSPSFRDVRPKNIWNLCSKWKKRKEKKKSNPSFLVLHSNTPAISLC